MAETSWTAGDVSESETLTDNDHLYPGYTNELRVAVNVLEVILDPDTSVLTSPIITSMQINDTSADHQYVFAVNELAADRTVTLPLLTGNDEFVFKAHTQTLTNKTLTSATLTSATLNTAVSGTAVLDEDAMTSNSATKIATQQSIKAYGDNTFLTKVSPTVSSGDLRLPDGGNIKDAATDPYKTIFYDARAWQPTTTSPCADIETIEAGTNDIDYDVLDFATDADENAFCNVWMPGNWDAGAIQFRFVWTNASGLTTETVTFELSGRSYSDSDAIDQAVGTAVEVADTWLAQGDVHYSAWSGDVTITGATAGEFVHLELMRDVSEDDLTGDARLIGVQIRYRESQYNHF